ncbi:MAG TPA: hypothetical protein VES62_17865, partial [Thermoleophilaceae bacterium]|nr:hypothetical protein [Thermoleophilaceae bacterium]
ELPVGQELRERREALVREHMESENQHDFETTLGTFGHPRYEIVPTGDVFDGRRPCAATSTIRGPPSPTSAMS